MVQMLLTATRPVTFAGTSCRLHRPSLPQVPPPELLPRWFLSGSSDAAIRAAATLGMTRLAYPLPPDRLGQQLESAGIRVGVLARARRADAWAVAHIRFPADHTGEQMHRLARQISDSK